jgi:putative ABC transport system ATP-binding protein
MQENTTLQMKDITKTYQLGGEDSVVLKGINLTIKRGEFVSILGPSGSGKSTLMNILGCLDSPTSGSYTFAGHDISAQSESEMAKIRNKDIGFVFQSFHLMKRQNARENVELPLVYARVSAKERHARANSILERVGLKGKEKSYPNQLSGGQQQRVAIARALVGEPTILLADEPTGALDQKTGFQVLDIFLELNKEGRTIVLITHDQNIAQYADRTVRILDGELFEGDESHV